MPWGEKTIIEHVLGIWLASGVEQTVVVVRPDDLALADACRRAAAEVVVPSVAPIDIKESVRFGLDHIAQHYQPSTTDAWLLSPADMPEIQVSTIDQVAKRFADCRSIVVPTFQGRRGHPVLFPWSMATQVGQLGENEGLNALVKRSECEEVETNDPGCVRDIDSPDDYRRLKP